MMMKRGKRSNLLNRKGVFIYSLLLLSFVFTNCVYANEFVYERISDTECVITQYTGNSDYVEVPEKIDNLTVCAIRTNTEKPVFPATVKSISLPNRTCIIEPDSFSTFIGIKFRTNWIKDTFTFGDKSINFNDNSNVDEQTKSEEELDTLDDILKEAVNVNFKDLADVIDKNQEFIVKNENAPTYVHEIKTEERQQKRIKVSKQILTIKDSIPTWVIILVSVLVVLIITVIIVLICFYLHQKRISKRRRATRVPNRRKRH